MIRTVQIPLGILIDKGLPSQCQRMVVPVYSISDSFLLVYVQKFIQNSDQHVTFFDVNDIIKTNLELKEAIRAIDHAAPNHITIISSAEAGTADFTSFDLMLISLSAWKQLVQEKQSWLSKAPTSLVLKP